MKSPVLSGLMAVSLGLLAVASLPGSAHADDDGFEYRIIGCSGPPTFGIPGPPPEPSFDVVYSLDQDDVGLPCETVLSSLGNRGFQLVEVRPVAESLIGVLHYLERGKDD